MTEDEHPLGAVCGHDDLAHLPPKKRARLRRDWLAARTWKPSQAVAVLCGYDPEVGRNTCAADMAFLPGADDFYGVPFGAREPDDLRALDAGLEEQHGYIGGLRLTTMKPKEALAKAVAAGVPIPWLDAARADHVCRKYLPTGIKPRSNRSNSSYSPRLKKWPDWPERVDYAFSLYSQGLSTKAAEAAFAEKYADGPEISGWLREFQKGVTAETKTAGIRAFIQERG